MPLDKRSQARVLALQALCVFEGVGDAFASDLEGFIHDRVNHADLDWAGPPDPPLLVRARELALGAWRQRARYDELLRRHVAGWSVERMQTVDRNILRLGLHELHESPQVPPAVVINEAIEMARHFGGTDSPAFVNGVLDAIRRSRVEQAAGTREQGPVSGEHGSATGAPEQETRPGGDSEQGPES